ncbi:LPS export ABC transporter periplasmic protein LptC [Lentimicrobium sp.]|uniref:LPS export ABC transporter periplasmic protein LptC n=1 Tax=Lentimicrobium sp. TaxID=2034841 RepID=UPI0026011664|nr:LPS export ABC transporter periplasmic protein LptC [Lentimicrobium sp.]MCO5258159.1 LPS export ABC transporter periplasmic protein LptC [Lentimicrobium sp.]MCO5263493.1 LPS export ABC transporter periplasmic protein LptC [Lentimicrobium sp.]HPF64724.1 LPS export ABC transporter periplasmic protein LptC [Lentimicrobium sp.]HPJ63616.1 LPS export ABC transporter periplasmic protein LptC [Lentimicrobium sp.]HPR27355.1 LPS export ABC transporter periplasmic protein LptC [Lentimicrobium sp.]
MKSLSRNTLFIITLKSVATFTLVAALFGCKNDLSEVARLNQPDTMATMYAKEVSISESEQGRIKYTLTAPVLRRYESPEGALIRFPEGFRVIFYDSLNPEQVRTEITADYGINNEMAKTMEARRNVVVTNYLKNEKLNTEHLIWDQNTKRVNSDVMVTITTPDKILYGEGMEADEKFYNWIIKKPRGEMYINEDQ